MTVPITSMTDAETTTGSPDDETGLGALRTERGNLPLACIDVRAQISGLTSSVELRQDFVNAFDVPLEATYVFPLPDRGAVTRMQMTADGRVIEAELREREAAREAYDEAVASGRRASIAEEERPDVFTMRVGNILPGERVNVALTLVSPLAYADGEATFRFPLVVAPRYIPGDAFTDAAVGARRYRDGRAVTGGARLAGRVAQRRRPRRGRRARHRRAGRQRGPTAARADQRPAAGTGTCGWHRPGRQRRIPGPPRHRRRGPL